MISRQYAAWLAMQAIYDAAGRAQLFDELLTVGNDVIGVKVINDTITITPEGTFNIEGWKEDFTFLPEPGQDSDPVIHPVWGAVHGNFLKCVEDIYAVVKPLTAGLDIAIQGHSRAAALADGLASRFALDGIKVSSLSMFESPRFGQQQYVEWARRQVKNGIINLYDSTRNGPDPVVLVPPAPWQDTYPMLELNAAPGGLKDIIAIEWHMSAAVYPGYLKVYPDRLDAKILDTV
jgi:hypothetical protein